MGNSKPPQERLSVRELARLFEGPGEPTTPTLDGTAKELEFNTTLEDAVTRINAKAIEKDYEPMILVEDSKGTPYRDKGFVWDKHALEELKGEIDWYNTVETGGIARDQISAQAIEVISKGLESRDETWRANHDKLHGKSTTVSTAAGIIPTIETHQTIEAPTIAPLPIQESQALLPPKSGMGR